MQYIRNYLAFFEVVLTIRDLMTRHAVMKKNTLWLPIE
jgi:hypothetical protein